MTVNRGLWVPINTGNVGTTEVEARLADAGLFESNNGTDPRSGLLSPASSTVVTGKSDMSFDVGPFTAVIGRAANEGAYRFTATGVTNVTTTAAPATNSRIDMAWVRQNDQSKGDANNLAVLGVTQGTVAASPTAPALQSGQLELARATITAGMVATSAASITQTFRYAALRGAPITVRNAAERAEITAPRPGQQVRRLDLGWTVVETWDGANWYRQSVTFAKASAVGFLGAMVAGASIGPSWQTFPVGRFTVPPIVTVTTDQTRLSPAAGGVTTAGFNLYVDNFTSASSNAGEFRWIAEQMTPTSAGG